VRTTTLVANLAPIAMLTAAPALSGCRSAAPEAPFCAGAGSCASGYCVAGRCRAEDALPSPLDAQRLLLSPEDVAVLASKGASGDVVPDGIALGRAASGDVVMLMRFAVPWQDDAEIASAFVVIDPIDGAQPAAEALTLEAARILDPWRSATASWGRQPRLSVPRAAAIVRRAPRRPLRIDVTGLVRGWAQRRSDDHGIAILAPGDDAVGTACSLGISQGAGPRLEVYLR
jgi:hypothetical protein